MNKESRSILQFMIPLPPITKKNSQRIAINNRTGKPFVMPSEKYKNYEESALWFLKGGRVDSGEYPVNVKCLFYMPTRRRCDLTNLLESIDDILVKAGVLIDDDFLHLAAHDGSRVLYDKDKPRTEIYIETMPD